MKIQNGQQSCVRVPLINFLWKKRVPEQKSICMKLIHIDQFYVQERHFRVKLGNE